MKALFSIGRYWPAVGGAETIARELAHRLAVKHEVGVAALLNSNEPDFLGRLRRPPAPADYQDGAVEVHLLCPPAARKPFLEAYIQLACRRRLPGLAQAFFGAAYGGPLGRIIREADIIHALPAMSMSLVRLTIGLAQRHKKVSIITPHLHSAEEALGMSDILSRASGAIALTATERDWLVAAGMPAEKVEVTGIGHTPPRLSPQRGRFRRRYDLQGPLVLFLGRKEEYKGYREMLEAAPLVWRREPEVIFAFIGPPTPLSQRAFLNWRGEKRILELPTIPEYEKPEALADCDVLCVPSTMESFGHVILEAWCAGKPVIAADIPVAREVVGHEEEGLLAAQEPEQIAEAVVRIVRNPQKAAEMGEMGRAKVISQYSWEKVAARTFAVYARILKSATREESPCAVS